MGSEDWRCSILGDRGDGPRLRLMLPALAAGLLGAAVSSSADPIPQWAPEQVSAPLAWAKATGAGVKVAIIDTGVDLDHPDLAANLTFGATFTSDLGCFAPTAACDGDWKSPSEGAGAPHPHGTHVAGIVGAADNGIGIVGVAPDVTLVPVKAGDATGFFDFDIAAAIEWAVDVAGVDVLNLSLGEDEITSTFVAFDPSSSAYFDALAHAEAAGVVVVAAAGNVPWPVCTSPASHPAVLCVVATGKREGRSWFSSGPLHPSANTVSAPGGSGLPPVALPVPVCGENIISTVPTGTAGGPCKFPPGGPPPLGDYDEMAGTSQATPHVAGVAALLVELGCSAPETVAIIKETARVPGTSIRGIFTPSHAWGVVDAAAAVEVAVTACT